MSMRLSGYQTRFAAQHIGTYIMVNVIHRALARIRVGDVVGSLIILSYLCFYGDALRECKSAVLTRIQFKLFARSIKIRTSHDAFQVRTATHRTSVSPLIPNKIKCCPESQDNTIPEFGAKKQIKSDVTGFC